MEVDQIKRSKGKGKGNKPDKPTCKTCGTSHSGKCWYHEASKGKKGDQPTGGDPKPANERCQICGKKNHTADRRIQRYKDKDGKRLTGASSERCARDRWHCKPWRRWHRDALSSRNDVETSETELRKTTAGCEGSSIGADRQAMIRTCVLQRPCPRLPD